MFFTGPPARDLGGGLKGSIARNLVALNWAFKCSFKKKVLKYGTPKPSKGPVFCRATFQPPQTLHTL